MKKEIVVETAAKQETAVLVAVSSQRQTEKQTLEYLDELEFLAATLGVKTLKRFYQNLEKPDPKTFVGTGKLADIVAFVKQHEVDMMIFDDELNSAQVRNLERELDETCKVLDRPLLILQIFMFRAQTAQARTQVELAQYQYMLPRLTRLWTHLSRQKGGIGMRGPGESELETDKRIIRDKIILLKDKLEKIEKQKSTQRRGREQMVRVSLVGYTNVGKSTIMKLISKADVFAENKLFATVDSKVSKVVIDALPFLLTDTVGFIRKLPTMLIESFKSTLAEIVESDLLLHIVDVSHESFEEQMDVVNKTLAEIGAADKRMIVVFNKIDQFKNPEAPALFETGEPEENAAPQPDALEQLKNSYLAKGGKAIFISASEETNIKEFKTLLVSEVRKLYFEIYPNYLTGGSYGAAGILENMAQEGEAE